MHNSKEARLDFSRMSIHGITANGYVLGLAHVKSFCDALSILPLISLWFLKYVNAIYSSGLWLYIAIRIIKILRYLKSK